MTPASSFHGSRARQPGLQSRSYFSRLAVAAAGSRRARCRCGRSGGARVSSARVRVKGYGVVEGSEAAAVVRWRESDGAAKREE